MEDDTIKKPTQWSIFKLARSIWFIGLLGALFNTWNSMECGIYTPFLYSRVQCCGVHGPLPQKYDITLPKQIQAIQEEAKTLGLGEVMVVKHADGKTAIPACSLPDFPSGSKLWSRSSGCVSSGFVEDRSQHVIGLNTPLQTVATLLVLPVGGAVADRCGRYPVFIVYAAMITLACVIFVFDTKLFSVWGDAMVLIAGMMMCPCWEPKDTVLAGAISDVVGNSGPNLAQALSMQQGFIQFGWLFGFVFALIALGFHLECYFVPWIIFTGVACSILVLLRVAVPETLPKELQGGVTMYMFNPLKTQWDALLMIWQDWFLVLLMLNGITIYVHLVGFLTILFTYLMKLGFGPQEAMVPNLVIVASQICCLAVTSTYGSKFGVMSLYAFGNVMFIPTYLFFGPLLIPIGHAAPYIAAAFLGVALGCWFPASATIISSRVGEAHQAKCQSAIAWICKIGCAVGPPIWNFTIFDATATGFAFIRPAFVSLLLSLATAAIALYMRAREDSFPVVLKEQVLAFEKDSILPVKTRSSSTSYGIG